MSYSFGQHITIGEKTMSFSVKFHLSRKLADGKHTVLVFISGYEKAKRLRISTDVSIESEKHFDTKKRSINAKDSFFEMKNRRLKSIETAILKAWYTIQEQYEQSEHLPNTSEIEDKLRYAVTKRETQKANFFAELQKFIETKDTPKTKANYIALKNSLMEHNPSWSWKECTDDGITKYTKHLLQEKKLKSGTANVRVVYLRSFLNYCAEKNIVSLNNSYKKTEVPKASKAKKRHLLNKEQLIQYSRFHFSDKRQSIAKNLFLFATVTGQRISDVWRIKPESVVNNIWHFFQQKTGVEMEIPLIDAAVQMLKETNYFAEIKSIAARSKRKDGVSEPCNDFNKDLKESFRNLGLIQDVYTPEGVKQHFETICFHDARALFSTLCQQYRYSDSLARTITGHQSKDTLNDYQKTSNETKLKMLQNIFQGL